MLHKRAKEREGGGKILVKAKDYYSLRERRSSRPNSIVLVMLSSCYSLLFWFSLFLAFWLLEFHLFVDCWLSVIVIHCYVNLESLYIVILLEISININTIVVFYHCHPCFLGTITYCNEKNCIDDASFTSIVGKGTIPLTTKCTLHFVLHVPKLVCN